MKWTKILGLIFLISVTIFGVNSKKPKEKPEWAKKSILDFTDADMARLEEQWEEDDEPLPDDELPDGHPLKPTPLVDFNKLDMSDPEGVLKATKKGKTIMMFVRVSGNPSRAEAEEITALWQTSLWNNHIQLERFMLEDDRCIFMFKDGAMAWESKDFLVEQERCQEVTIEQKSYYGKFTEQYKMEQQEDKGKKKEKSKKKKTDEL